jgi:hypothetical protein
MLVLALALGLVLVLALARSEVISAVRGTHVV